MEFNGVYEGVHVSFLINSLLWLTIDGILRWRNTYRLPGLISSQDTEAEACVLPPKENVLLLAIWHWNTQEKIVRGLYSIRQKSEGSTYCWLISIYST